MNQSFYPKDLAQFTFEKLKAANLQGHEHSSWLREDLLERLFSVCYQASLSTIEGRPVTCRLIMSSPEIFEQLAVGGLHCLRFAQYSDFSRQELRRLSTAADYTRSLLGICSMSGKVSIWGIVHSGSKWLHALQGGRASAPEMPDCLVVNITGPGHLEILWGTTVIAELVDGELAEFSTNVFRSKWLQNTFSEIRAERQILHRAAKNKAPTVWAELDPDLTRIIDQHMTQRVIAAMRAYRHGGTLLMIPPEKTSQLTAKNPFVSFKHIFVENEHRARFRTLIVSVMNRLAEIGAGSKVPVGWKDYQLTTDTEIGMLDEAIFELAHLIAALSVSDGAVVLSKRFEPLGFGAEIHCDTVGGVQVARALDLEGRRKVLESTNRVGTRHSSVYRFCQECKDCLAIVVSQDGAVQFVRFDDGVVTCWNHRSSFEFSTDF